MLKFRGSNHSYMDKVDSAVATRKIRKCLWNMIKAENMYTKGIYTAI